MNAIPATDRNGVAARPPLRVLVLTNMWPTADHPAFGTFVASQTRSAAEAGVAVRVHFITGYRSRRAFMRSSLRMLELNFAPRRFDLIHAHGGYSGAVALLQRRIPVLTSYVGYDLLGEPGFDWKMSPKSRIEAAVFRQLARFFDGTITKSAEMERALPRRARSRNTILPNGVDRQLFRPCPRGQARKQLGWPDEEPVVMFVGDPAWGRKRFDLAATAVESARDEFPDLQLRVCTRVPQKQVPVWMNAADVLILTSNVEGSPNVVKEAMACNLPVVSVDAGDARDIIDGARHCHIVPRDPAALASALCEVLRCSPCRSDGRSRTSHLSLGAIRDRLLATYVAVTGIEWRDVQQASRPMSGPRQREAVSV